MSVRTTASFAKASSGPVVDLTTAALAAQSKKSNSKSQYSPAGRRAKPVSSDSRNTSSTAVSSAASTSSAQTNFPSYDNTDWGDPIATAQAKNVGKKPGRARKNKAKKWVDAQPILELEVPVPEGGPNGSWAPEDVEF
jgi:hypothetical protein